MSKQQVICVHCGKKANPAISGSQTQGDGIACLISASGVQGCFGSNKHDFELFTWIGHPRYVNGSLCDQCIDNLIASHNLKTTDQTMW